MKITRIDCHVLLDPAFDIGSTSSAQDDIVVEIHTDEGLTGIGETDVNPWIARACIEAPGTHTMGLGLAEMLLGQDPLHDLRGKALGKPCYELLGGTRRQFITPYASLQPEVSDFERYKSSLVKWAQEARQRGFRAAKLEVTPTGPYAHKGLRASHQRMTEAIAAVREAVGPSFVLMVDVQYAFPDATTCLATIREWESLDLYFVETPIPADDLEG